jgi:hypothetical protein
MLRMLSQIGVGLAFAGGALGAESLVLVPANPGPLDTVRIQWTHVGCTNRDSMQVSQQANRITVRVDRTFFPDCGTISGYFEEFTLGRLPSGGYDAELVVNPPPGTLGPSQVLGPIAFVVAPLPPSSVAAPHEDYSDMWWNPRRSGEALMVKQAGDKLFAVWVAYDPAGRATWFSFQPGSWVSDANSVLRFAGIVYRSNGPYWGGAYDPALVTVTPAGSADFIPQAVSRARFDFTIDGVAGSIPLERIRF